ncbi:MAG: heme-binding protein [Pseudomonadota bacterium]
MTLTFENAETIAASALDVASKREFSPLCVAVVDSGGHLLCLKRQDGATINRPNIAIGKASGCIGLGVGGRALAEMADARPCFVSSLASVFPNGCVPVQGGVLIRDNTGQIQGAVGITGDTSENDELCAIRGIEAAGFTPDSG